MDQQSIKDIAASLVGGGKGLLAIDESMPTCNLRFKEVGIPQTFKLRLAYRDLIIETPGLAASLNGFILSDEMIRQVAPDGTPLIRLITDAGLIAGIKVDRGAKPLAGFTDEKITEGLDGLRARLGDYLRLGARFAKWRAVFRIGEGIPSRECIEANAHTLARFASLSQEAGLVPVVEPEVLPQGNHSLQRCHEVTRNVLRAVFNHLNEQRVVLESMVLKCNMVTPGRNYAGKVTDTEISDATVRCLLQSVPAVVPGIAFLSGGQPAVAATRRLNDMNLRYKASVPWALTFSFGRAIQQPALKLWAGQPQGILPAQNALRLRAACNREAARGAYQAFMESANER